MNDHKRTTGCRWLAVIVSLLLSLAAWPAVASAEQKPAFPDAPKNSNYVAAVTANPRGGKKAALTIHVSKKSACSLSFQGPAGLKTGPVKGHFTKRGFGSWSWRVPHHVRKGTWTAKVRCQQDKTVRTLRAVLHVAGKSKKHVSIARARGFKFVRRATAPAPNLETDWGKGAGGYPDANATDCSAKYGIYSWCKGGWWLSARGFAYRNCTDFVSWYMGIPRSKFGFPSGVGNAADWKAYAGRAGLAVSGSPSVGDIAWWGSSVAGGYGHVAIVTAVAGNGSVTIAEYNGDGRGNYGIRPNMRAQAYLHLPGSNTPGSNPTTPAGPNYQAFAGDFDGDGVGDIGLRNTNDGTFFIKHGPAFNDQITYPWAGGLQYQPFIGDFDGDGKDDIGLRHVPDGMFFIKHGPTFNDQITYPWAGGTQYQAFAADFNGDGKADIALRHMIDGMIFIKHGTNFDDQITYPWAGSDNYQPFAGDFDGDGIGDIGLRNISDGTFFIKHGPSFNDQVAYPWAGGIQYQPFVGDFNGDGKDDIGLRHLIDGLFFIKHGPSFNDQVTYPWAAS